MTNLELQAWRQRHSFTQSDVAVMCGVSDRAVRNWLTGDAPVPGCVALLALAVDDGLIGVEWLAGALLRLRPAPQSA